MASGSADSDKRKGILRTRFHEQHYDHNHRESPLHWSSESDEEQDNQLERSPSPALESPEYVAEDRERFPDYKKYGKERYNRDLGSPSLNRRTRHQYGVPEEECSEYRDSNKEHLKHYQSNDHFAKVQSDRKYIRDVYCPKSNNSLTNTSKQELQGKYVSYQKLVWLVVIVLVLCVGTLYAGSSAQNDTTDEREKLLHEVEKEKLLHEVEKEKLLHEVKVALSNFENIPANAVFQFFAGIWNILEDDHNRPSIFVLLYKDGGQGPYCLANAIAGLAMNYLDSNETHPLVLKPDELLNHENMTQDYGWIMEYYKPLIEKHRSVVVYDLQKLPGKMAMAFHFFCDAENPSVPKTLYIFTLQEMSNSSEKEVERTESTMHDIWRNEISDDQRQALITRLTEDVISLPSNILPRDECPH